MLNFCKGDDNTHGAMAVRPGAGQLRDMVTTLGVGSRESSCTQLLNVVHISTLSATAPGLSIVGNRSLLCHYGRHTFCPLESLFIGEMYQPILLVFFSMAEMAYLSVRWERIDGECKNCRSR